MKAVFGEVSEQAVKPSSTRNAAVCVESAAMSGRYKSVGCEENMAIADFLSAKSLDYRSEEKANLHKTLESAIQSFCKIKKPVTNLQEAKQVRNVGPWILKFLKEYFDKKQPQMVDEQQSYEDQPSSSEQPASPNAKGKKVGAERTYCPKKNTAAFALLITLHRAHQAGKSFMMKKELIEETEKSGLSNQPIMPKGASRSDGQPNRSDWYCGWNGMTTLINKILVIKKSNPAKYMLTEEGTKLALECLRKAGMQEDDVGVDPEREGNQATTGAHIQSPAAGNVQRSRSVKAKTKTKAHPPGGPDASNVENGKLPRRSASESERPRPVPPIVRVGTSEGRDGRASVSLTQMADHRSLTTEATLANLEDDLVVPPLRLGERFEDVYDVIFILDRRERFRNQSGASTTHLQQFVEKLERTFKINVEVRQIPVGDGLWIARHKQLGKEYVLDFAFERKRVDDLWTSIKNNRYKEQKQRLLSCGLKRLFYLVEGDVNAVESTESLKTAMVTTELQGGFRVLRTTDTADTSRQYGHMTHAIISRYKMEEGRNGVRVCKTYNEFLEHCRESEEDQVKDVFCRMLTQIPQVTEDVALSIVEKYPTVISLVEDYADQENDREAEKVLQGIPIRHSTKTITAGMSRKVFQALWSFQSNAVLNI